MVAAVVFDAFGTLLWRHSKLNPYRELLREGALQGRKPRADDVRRIMALDCDLAEIASLLGIELSADRQYELQSLIEADLSGIRVYPDAQAAIDLLQRHGIVAGVCSNLAQPYGSAIRSLFPNLDAYAHSYELGFLKPDPEIYAWLRNALASKLSGGRVEQIWMIGDSLRCDRNGARAAGFMGYQLHRGGFGEFTDLHMFAEFVIASRAA
ncbi:HAD family hydrolase [Pseudomonas fulva]|uniref:HAD family hydrolase n=1 Tax=Pseudomonas fulva TaxID=47880 RepID=UPI00201DECC0|nr:HAD family hydrolase [Pseudomonas fulva]UQY32991.1 HAD family hydrolase [Pseudomonas fulva]